MNQLVFAELGVESNDHDFGKKQLWNSVSQQYSHFVLCSETIPKRWNSLSQPDCGVLSPSHYSQASQILSSQMRLEFDVCLSVLSGYIQCSEQLRSMRVAFQESFLPFYISNKNKCENLTCWLNCWTAAAWTFFMQGKTKKHMWSQHGIQPLAWILCSLRVWSQIHSDSISLNLQWQVDWMLLLSWLTMSEVFAEQCWHTVWHWSLSIFNVTNCDTVMLTHSGSKCHGDPPALASHSPFWPTI